MTPNSFRLQLARSAQDFAQKAIRSFLDGDWPTFALDAGVSLEQLCKAALAAIHPSLIIKGGNLVGLLYAAGYPRAQDHGSHALIRTISAPEAQALCAKLYPEFRDSSDAVVPLFELRNASAHLGAFDEAASRKVLPSFLKALDSLLAPVQVSSEEFWHDRREWVVDRLIEAKDETEREVADALERARLRFVDLYGKLTEDETHNLITARQATTSEIEPDEIYEKQLAQCPACKCAIVVDGISDLEYEMNSDGFGDAYVVFAPIHLSCRVCRLSLVGSEQIEAAGIVKWEPEDLDPSQLYEDEPWDDDWRRD